MVVEKDGWVLTVVKSHFDDVDVGYTVDSIKDERRKATKEEESSSQKRSSLGRKPSQQEEMHRKERHIHTFTFILCYRTMYNTLGLFLLLRNGSLVLY